MSRVKNPKKYSSVLAPKAESYSPKDMTQLRVKRVSQQRMSGIFVPHSGVLTQPVKGKDVQFIFENEALKGLGV